MRRKKLPIVIVVVVLLLLTAGIIGYRMYNKPHASADTAAALEVTATALAAAFENNEARANQQYLGKALQVSGTVSDLTQNQQQQQVLVLNGAAMSAVQCTLMESVQGIKKGDSITIRGFCNGFLTDVIIDRCVLRR
ncbi:MAG TPA: hypothetical protein VL307_17270 [Chitinophagaceae bacterium]|jgi:hypothetical protein|nr:hypothetical protein [Chitinophagaceae bacterium]